jgi:hypothetical protein
MIANSYSTAAVASNSSFYTGGLVGAQFGSASIADSYASGTVSGAGSTDVGGLVGANMTGTITNAYATGAVSGGTNVGGLIGNNAAGSGVSLSYAAGAVSASVTAAGGLAGNNNGTIAQSYFDKQATGQTLGVGSGTAAGTGLTTATFQDGSLPNGFSATIWTAASNAYPQLAWQSAVAPSAPQIIAITVKDSDAGTVVYGSAAPSFSYTVTDTNGNVLCAANCSAYFSGTPLIDTTYSSTDAAATAAPGYIAHGTVVPQSGYAIHYVNDLLTINPAPVSIIALGGFSTFGTAPTNPGLIAIGLQNGQNVSVLTGLRNSFGITSDSRAGTYVLNVVGALTNPNYRVTSVSSGSWTVAPLRGPTSDSSPCIAELSIVGPTSCRGSEQLWCRFDPVVISAHSLLGNIWDHQPPSDVARRFDDVSARGLAARLRRKLHDMNRPGIRRGGRPSANP